jgi:serine/threonine protein kinase
MYCPKCRTENVDAADFCIRCGADLKRLTPGLKGSASPLDTLDAARTHVLGDFHAGRVLAGQYRIVGDAPLGSGAMGEVWKAIDTELDMPVALKVLPPMVAVDALAVENLKNEAALGRRISHPGICRIFSLHSDGRVKFIVMEYVEGRTLARVLAESPGRRMTWEVLKPIARAVGDALDYAHSLKYRAADGREVVGILHRDIKPANIMITDDGQPRLLDFGIARELHNTMTMLTGRSSQTPLYASPEQYRGRPLSAASDLYSFATVLYECLAGHPHIAPHGNLGHQILHEPFDPLEDQSTTVNAILAAGLSKDPAARPKTARAMLEGTGLSWSPEGERFQAGLQSGDQNATEQVSGKACGGSGKRRLFSRLFACTVIVLLIALVVILALSRLGTKVVESMDTVDTVLPTDAVPTETPVGVPPESSVLPDSPATSDERPQRALRPGDLLDLLTE